MSDTHHERDSSRRVDPSGESVSTGGPSALPEGTAFQLLDNRRRRYLVYCLLANDGEVSLSRAVDAVTAWETDRPAEDVRSTDRRCVYSTLRRSHLPRLEAEEVVAYDADAGTVALGPDAESVTRWLVGDGRREWSRRYLGLAAASALFLVADLLAAPPAVLPEGAEHAAVAVVFVGLTAAAAYDRYRS